MSKFVFISYKREDRGLVRPWLKLLEDNQIEYWWDQKIEQDWGKEIDQKLEECSAVVGFMTPSSLNSDAVYVEFKTAKNGGKLFPVKLEECAPPYHFREALGSLSYVDLSNTSQEIEHEKRKLISKLRNMLEPGTGSSFVEIESSHGDLEQWFSTKERRSQVAYIVALSFFEGQNHDFIQNCAAQLEREFADSGLGDLLELNSKLVTRTRKFDVIGAQLRSYSSGVTGSAIDSVAFEDAGFGEKVFLYVWNELDQLKHPIIRWINSLLDASPASCVGDIAAMLSLIGRQNFQSIYSLILRPWLNQAWSWKFLCADIALSLMMDDRGIKQFIGAELLQIGVDAVKDTEAAAPDGSLSDSGLAGGDATEGVSRVSGLSQMLSRESGIALVTGYTGMRMPDLSVALFKRIDGEFEGEAASGQGSVLYCIDKGIDYLLMRVKTDPYAQTLPLVFANGIHGWMSEEGDKRKTVLPEYILLRLLVKLTLRGKGAHGAQSVSLHDILADGDTPNPRAVDTFGKAIAAALECGNKFIRDEYIAWMRMWKMQINASRKESVATADQVLDARLFSEIFGAARKHATSTNDVDRIEFHTASN